MQSFRHFLNKGSDQKTSLTKIVQFGMIFEKVIQKVKVKLSCDQKPVIWSISILSIDSKNFFLQKWFSLICYLKKSHNKLGLSCAKLRPAWASYQLAFVWLAFTEGAYYA